MEKQVALFIKSLEKKYGSWKRSKALFGYTPYGKIASDLAYQEKPSIRLHKLDGTHPNILGTYLAACTVFGSIYGKKTIGLKYDYFGAINEKDKIFLQKIADKVTSMYYNKEY